VEAQATVRGDAGCNGDQHRFEELPRGRFIIHDGHEADNVRLVTTGEERSCCL